MKQGSIFRQLLVPVLLIVCILAAALVSVMTAMFFNSYEKDIYEREQGQSKLMAGEIGTFLDGAYAVTEELAVNPSILTMDTGIQTPILADCVARNTYLELLYIQGADGMQTGRSSGELADRSTRWWFTQTMNEKKSFISQSYYSVNTGMPCASIFFPMYDADSIIGIFAVDLKLDYLQDIIENFSDPENGEISFVIDGEGVVVAHPDNQQIEQQYNYKTLKRTVSETDANGNAVTDADGNVVTKEETFLISEAYQQVIADAMSGGTGSTKIICDGDTYYASYAPIPLKGDSDSWSVITLREKTAAMSSVYRTALISVAIVFAAIILAVFIIVIVARRLVNPVVSVTKLISDAANGDFQNRANETIPNELGILSRSFNNLTGKMAGILVTVTEFTTRVVEGSDRLKDIAGDIDGTHQSVERIAQGTHDQTEDARNVVERAADLEEKFRELQSKSESLLNNARDTMKSGEQGAQSVAGLKNSNTVTERKMEESYSNIMKLDEHSQRIAGIITTINEISEETELLSLNASIEAARAGEAGRGFMVVAESIGKLAADSQTATQDIENIIKELCRDIVRTVENIQEIRGDIQKQTEMVDFVEKSFGNFQSLAQITKDSVGEMETLVAEMQELDRAMVDAADHIQDVSQNTANVTQDIADSMQEQVSEIQRVAKQVYDLSIESEQIRQRLSGQAQ
ncbi:MAG: methyl-accepting chemotaxis protein [Lachnospiraceae bacterium]|nr:methyl-accepting chemotaxis protein [Lachnospiraceae bacterium]